MIRNKEFELSSKYATEVTLDNFRNGRYFEAYKILWDHLGCIGSLVRDGDSYSIKIDLCSGYEATIKVSDKLNDFILYLGFKADGKCEYIYDICVYYANTLEELKISIFDLYSLVDWFIYRHNNNYNDMLTYKKYWRMEQNELSSAKEDAIKSLDKQKEMLHRD